MTCQKIPYETKSAALADAKALGFQRKRYSKRQGKVAKSGRKLTPYECYYCGKWHLTTTKRK